MKTTLLLGFLATTSALTQPTQGMSFSGTQLTCGPVFNTLGNGIIMAARLSLEICQFTTEFAVSILLFTKLEDLELWKFYFKSPLLRM
jgi:hypothetical protein